VAGDALDVATLVPALSADTRPPRGGRGRHGLCLAATALDVAVAMRGY
jgi:hypothetical protein